MKNKAAMEMSVGTLVTIVLLMAVLGLGLYLVSNIFTGSTDAVENINNQVINEINEIFSSQDNTIAVYPSDRSIIIKKEDTPKGFAFSIRNKDVEDAEFSYIVEADDISNCGSSFSIEEAESYLLGGQGSFSLGKGNALELPRLVKFDVPGTAPPCTIIYTLEVKKDGESYASGEIFVAIE